LLCRKWTSVAGAGRRFGAATVACVPGVSQSSPKALPPASLWAMTNGNVELDQQFAQQFAATPGMQVKIEPIGEVETKTR
jgi:hypothetical protein